MFIIDIVKVVSTIPGKCTGCRLCELACVNFHRDNLFDFQPAIRVYRDESGLSFYPFVCRQCEEEFCVSVCPTNSLARGSDGVVRWNENTCIFCKQCVMACEYESIHFSPNKKEIIKCDTCNGEFSCVNTCPYGALEIKEIAI